MTYKVLAWVYFCKEHKKEITDIFGLSEEYFLDDREFPLEVCSFPECNSSPVCRDIKTVRLSEDDW